MQVKKGRREGGRKGRKKCVKEAWEEGRTEEKTHDCSEVKALHTKKEMEERKKHWNKQ